ncbi:hypothetical protein PV04_07752 [Phialophora macrospora]|uniref:Uncharacterized protein n=1 Tax=Phialophora macrospora TaxID=1851006 RepID=A0A0D2FFB1_9EURO|nr:hypothetical protein PV04_07752 [Phialophora macrospora]
MLPIRRAYLSTSNEVPSFLIRYQPQSPSDRFNKAFRNICSLQDHGHFDQATAEARQLSGSNEQQRRLAKLLLSSLQLFSVGSVKKTVSTCATLEPVVSRLLRQDFASIAPVDFQLIFIWFHTLAEIHLRRSSLQDLSDLRQFLVMAFGLPPMFENGGNPSTANTGEGKASDMLARHWRELRVVRGGYVNRAHYAEAFDLFSVSWMLYAMFDNDCKQLSALEDDYQELKRFAGSLRLAPPNNAIAHCWCAAVASGADLPAREVESELMAIAKCLPPKPARDGLEQTVATFALLLAKSLKQETPPEFVPAAAVIEQQTMNRGQLCSEIQAVDVDRSDMAGLCHELAQARDSLSRTGLWKQVASIDKMLALQGIMLGNGAAGRQRYLDLARTAEAQGMGPVYIFDAQRRAYTVTQALKIVGFGAGSPLDGTPVPVERPEISWYEGFLRRFPEYDWEADCFSAKMTLLGHYAVLNDRDKVKSLIYDIADIIPGLSGFTSRVGRDTLAPAVEWLGNMLQGRGLDAPNPFTPAQGEQITAALGLSPQFVQAAQKLQPTGINPHHVNRALGQYFPGAPEPTGMKNQLGTINAMLDAHGLLGGPARSMNAEQVERLERMIEKMRTRKPKH